jgi:antitoxin component YwqK of YwqJK toxin-antitoxin module
MDGLWTSWYGRTEEADRHMETRINYQDEIKDGFYEKWYPNGNKDKEGTYKNNKKIGKWSFWTPSGSLLDVKYY